MTAAKADIIARLQKEILPLQGFKTRRHNAMLNARLGPIKYAFPNAVFPLGAIHEFICSGAEEAAATTGFVSGILSCLMEQKGVCIWINSHKGIFPPALRSFGIAPDKIIFINGHKEKEILWVMEEALKCTGLSAVIGELPVLSFTASRRLQLAVEKSGVTGFIFLHHPGACSTTACLTRWKITPLVSLTEDGLPGVGFPRWNAALLKVRNGYPGNWPVEFAAGRFRHISQLTAIPLQRQKKIG